MNSVLEQMREELLAKTDQNKTDINADVVSKVESILKIEEKVIELLEKTNQVLNPARVGMYLKLALEKPARYVSEIEWVKQIIELETQMEAYLEKNGLYPHAATKGLYLKILASKENLAVKDSVMKEILSTQHTIESKIEDNPIKVGMYLKLIYKIE